MLSGALQGFQGAVYPLRPPPRAMFSDQGLSPRSVPGSPGWAPAPACLTPWRPGPSSPHIRLSAPQASGALQITSHAGPNSSHLSFK